jgi:hypothetical protein
VTWSLGKQWVISQLYGSMTNYWCPTWSLSPYLLVSACQYVGRKISALFRPGRHHELQEEKGEKAQGQCVLSRGGKDKQYTSLGCKCSNYCVVWTTQSVNSNPVKWGQSVKRDITDPNLFFSLLITPWNEDTFLRTHLKWVHFWLGPRMSLFHRFHCICSIWLTIIMQGPAYGYGYAQCIYIRKPAANMVGWNSATKRA